MFRPLEHFGPSTFQSPEVSVPEMLFGFNINWYDKVLVSTMICNIIVTMYVHANKVWADGSDNTLESLAVSRPRQKTNYYYRQISESNQYQIHVAETKLESKQVTINIPERLKYEIHSNL